MKNSIKYNHPTFARPNCENVSSETFLKKQNYWQEDKDWISGTETSALLTSNVFITRSTIALLKILFDLNFLVEGKRLILLFIVFCLLNLSSK